MERIRARKDNLEISNLIQDIELVSKAKIEAGLFTGDSEVDEASSKELDHLRELEKLNKANELIQMKNKMAQSTEEDNLVVNA